MNRIAAVALALAAVLGHPGAALADVTARYAAGTDVITVEVDDGGNARLGIDGKFSLISRDGVDYVVLSIDGKTCVARYADALAILPPLLAPNATGAAKDLPKEFLLTAGDVAEVAGRKGTSWSFGPDGEAPLTVVMSDDPALAPVGEKIRHVIGGALPALQRVLGPGSQFGALAAELLAKGTPLRVDEMALVSVASVDIDPRRFDLPGPVISAGELEKVLEAPVSTHAVAMDLSKSQ